MGQRLNIELTNENQLLCSCCWHEAAHTDYALDLTEAVIRAYDDIFNGSGADRYTAVKLFEAMGGGITGIERQRIRNDPSCLDQWGDYTKQFNPAHSVYDGIISITNGSIREARRWEQGRVKIDLCNKNFDFHVHFYTYREEYLEYASVVSSCVEWENLPCIEAGPGIFTGIFFDHIPMVRRIIESCPNGLRLSNGDVLEWM